MAAHFYTGQRLDGTGLLYYGARYYHPLIGRFTQADTIVPQPGNPQSLNRYAYTLNNPLRYTDPTGHCPWCIAIGKVLLQTAVDVGIDYLIAQATGTDFNLVDSIKVNAALNVTTLGVGSTVAKLRHLGKVALRAQGVAKYADEAADLMRLVGRAVPEGQVVSTLSQEALETIRKYGMKPYGEIARPLAEQGAAAHHLVEKRF